MKHYLIRLFILYCMLLFIPSCNLIKERQVKMEIRYEVLSDKEYEKKLAEACSLVKLKTQKEKDALRNKISNFQDNLCEKFSENWEEDNNWTVSWDFNYHYYTCGAIYSEKAYSKDYIIQAIKAINLQAEPSKWAYQTVIEIDLDPEGINDEGAYGDSVDFRGEFFIKNNTVYLKRSMKKIDRKKLGFIC